VALDSSAPHRAIVNGRIDPHQIDFAHRAFEASAPTDARVLVIHHHFVPTPDRTGGRTLPRARELVAEFERMQVDFVLGGHVHQTHVTTSDDLLGPRRRTALPLIACGTTTSGRGRGAEKGRNSLNLIHVREKEIEVIPHLAEPGTWSFEPRAPIVLPRAGSARADANSAPDGPQ
jgi:3',5'-cyclic AMP phosphodiesterase CpdA